MSFDNETFLDDGMPRRSGAARAHPFLMLNRGYVALVNNLFCYMYCNSYIHMGADPTEQGRGIKILIYSFISKERETDQSRGER